MSLDVNLSVEVKNQKKLLSLIESSHNKPMNFADCLHWDAGIDKTCSPKSPEHCWFYGTELYETFTPEQRHELLWLQIARDVSLFILLEQLLPVLYMGFVGRYQEEFPPEINEYLMIFSKEEIVHTMVFKRFLKEADLPFYHGEVFSKNLTEILPKRHPIMGILYTLLIEWVAELGAMHSTQGSECEPFTRQMFRQHHTDEARHIAFAKMLIESLLQEASAERHAKMKQVTHKLLSSLIPAYTLNQSITKYTSFQFPYAIDEADKFELIRNSDANKALNLARFAPLYDWLNKLELL